MVRFQHKCIFAQTIHSRPLVRKMWVWDWYEGFDSLNTDWDQVKTLGVVLDDIKLPFSEYVTRNIQKALGGLGGLYRFKSLPPEPAKLRSCASTHPINLPILLICIQKHYYEWLLWNNQNPRILIPPSVLFTHSCAPIECPPSERKPISCQWKQYPGYWGLYIPLWFLPQESLNNFGRGFNSGRKIMSWPVSSIIPAGPPKFPGSSLIAICKAKKISTVQKFKFH